MSNKRLQLNRGDQPFTFGSYIRGRWMSNIHLSSTIGKSQRPDHFYYTLLALDELRIQVFWVSKVGYIEYAGLCLDPVRVREMEDLRIAYYEMSDELFRALRSRSDVDAFRSKRLRYSIQAWCNEHLGTTYRIPEDRPPKKRREEPLRLKIKDICRSSSGDRRLQIHAKVDGKEQNIALEEGDPLAPFADALLHTRRALDEQTQATVDTQYISQMVSAGAPRWVEYNEAGYYLERWLEWRYRHIDLDLEPPKPAIVKLGQIAVSIDARGHARVMRESEPTEQADAEKKQACKRRTKRRKPGKEMRALALQFHRAGFTPDACRERAGRVGRPSHRNEWLAIADALDWMSASLRARSARVRRDAAIAPTLQLETPR